MDRPPPDARGTPWSAWRAAALNALFDRAAPPRWNGEPAAPSRISAETAKTYGNGCPPPDGFLRGPGGCDMPASAPGARGRQRSRKR